MNFFKEHLPGCMPLKPCMHCEVSNFLRSRLTTESLATLFEMTKGVSFTSTTVYKDAQLNEPISELELTLSSIRCLERPKVNSLGDLVTKTEEELIQYKNLGRKRLNEIKEVLASRGLTLGMKPELA